jgi:hypothetical protein
MDMDQAYQGLGKKERHRKWRMWIKLTHVGSRPEGHAKNIADVDQAYMYLVGSRTDGHL